MQNAFSVIRCTTLAIAIGSLCGCSVWVPYVEPPQAEKEADALDYARQAQERLRKAASEHAGFSSGMGTALIPLASLVAYKGFAGANSHNVAALSTAGAAGLGISSYVYRPRDLIYMAGASAIDCAIGFTRADILTTREQQDIKSAMANWPAESRSLNLDLATAATQLAQAQNELVTARAALARASRAATDAGTAASTSMAELTTVVRDGIDAATKATTDAAVRRESLHQRLLAVDGDLRARAASHERATTDLIDTTRSIVGQVNQQLATNQPDVSKLAEKLTGLKLPEAATKASATSAPASDSKSIADTVSARALAFKGKDLFSGPTALFSISASSSNARQARALAEAEAQIKVAVETLGRAMDEISAAIVKLDGVDLLVTAKTKLGSREPRSINVAKLLEQCGLDSKLPTPLTVSVPKDGAKVAPGKQLSLPIVGGAKPYAPLLVSKPSKGEIKLEILEGLGNSRTLIVTASAEVPSKTSYVILIQDARGSATQFALTVDG